MTTWAREIRIAMKQAGDTGPIIASTLTEEDACLEFYAGYGGAQGTPFTAWTETRVYFPVVYDGAEWVGSAPRDPCGERTEHQGGQ